MIRRLASENILWGQRRIQAELARLGFKVSARTVAKYMRLPHDREPLFRPASGRLAQALAKIRIGYKKFE